MKQHIICSIQIQEMIIYNNKKKEPIKIDSFFLLAFMQEFALSDFLSYYMYNNKQFIQKGIKYEKRNKQKRIKKNSRFF